jgi:hypothetical protein
MDDVSVSNGTAEMLLNGGSESGSLSPYWTTSNPNGGCNITGSDAQISSTSCHTGSYCLVDGCGGHADQISQSFVTTAGQDYLISFWLQQNGGTTPVIAASVTLS